MDKCLTGSIRDRNTEIVRGGGKGFRCGSSNGIKRRLDEITRKIFD